MDKTSDDEPHGLFKLPLELRQQIYALAYEDTQKSSGPFSIITEERGQEKDEWLGSMDLDIFHPDIIADEVLMTPRKCPPDNMVVNRQWYREAVQEWCRYAKQTVPEKRGKS